MSPNRGKQFDESWLPRLTSWQWSEVLDELYAHATWLWEHDREELADAFAELADVLGRHAMLAAGLDIDEDLSEADGVADDAWY